MSGKPSGKYQFHQMELGAKLILRGKKPKQIAPIVYYWGRKLNWVFSVLPTKTGVQVRRVG